MMNDKYRNIILNCIEDAKEIYKENLKCLLLGGSLAKGNEIDGWSDIDLYIITKKMDFYSNAEFFNKVKDYNIHVGTTFYSEEMIKNKSIDYKTNATIIEYNKYHLNKVLYGDITFPNIEKVDYTTKSYIGNLIQGIMRELYIYIKDKNNIKSLVKKTTVLLKVILETYYDTFTIGYQKVFKTYEEKTNIIFNNNILDIINTNDENNKLISMVCSILEDTIRKEINNEKNIG